MSEDERWACCVNWLCDKAARPVHLSHLEPQVLCSHTQSPRTWQSHDFRWTHEARMSPQARNPKLCL